MAAAIGAFLIFAGEGASPSCLDPNSCREATPEFAAAYNDPAACDGQEKRICLVPLGEVPKDLVDHLVAYYEDEYDLTLHVLPALDLEPGFDVLRPGQLEAKDLQNLFAAAYGRQSRDANAVLIGLTSIDIYTQNRAEWNWFFGQISGGRSALISVYRMDPVNWGKKRNDDLRNKRVRTLMNKYVAMGHYGLPLNDNPRSVLYRLIGSLYALDRIDERIPVPADRTPTRTPQPTYGPILTQTPLPSGVEATGVRIAQFYLDGLRTTRTVAESRPAALEMERTLVRLRDDFRAFLSELGCETDAMSIPERVAVFNAATKYADENGDDDFAWFMEAAEFYGEDSAVADLLNEINGLADYAMPDAYGGLRRQQTDCDN